MLPEAGLREEIIHRETPAGKRRLGFRDLTAPVDRRLVRVISPVDAYEVLTQHVHVPHNLGACRKVIGALSSDFLFGSRAVITLASNFNGENRGTWIELSAHWVATASPECD